MVSKGYHRSTDSKHHAGVNFAMSVAFELLFALGHCLDVHGNQRSLLFLYIQKLYKLLLK